MDNSFILSKPPNSKKKYKITFFNPATSRKNSLYFGQSGANDFTISKDSKAKANYLKRHALRENWDDLTTAGAWARWILWNQDTISKSVADMEKKFGIKIKII
jgi:hypothetical protein